VACFNFKERKMNFWPNKQRSKMPAYPSQEEVAQADHQLQLNADAETGIWPAFDS